MATDLKTHQPQPFRLAEATSVVTLATPSTLALTPAHNSLPREGDRFSRLTPPALEGKKPRPFITTVMTRRGERMQRLRIGQSAIGIGIFGNCEEAGTFLRGGMRKRSFPTAAGEGIAIGWYRSLWYLTGHQILYSGSSGGMG